MENGFPKIIPSLNAVKAAITKQQFDPFSAMEAILTGKELIIPETLGSSNSITKLLPFSLKNK